MAIGDVTKVIIEGNDDGVEWVTILHFETVASFGPKPQELLGLVDAVKEFLVFKQITNDALDFMHDTNFITGIKLRDIDDDTVGLDSAISSANGQGKLGGDRKANVLAVLQRKLTDKVGRSYQGRNFWNFLNEVQLEGDVILDSVRDDILEWFTTFLAITNLTLTFTFRLVVYSPTLGTVTPVTQTGIRDRMKTMRSRAE